MLSVKFYQSAAGNEPVKDFINARPEDEQLLLGAAVKKVQATYPNVGAPHVETVRGKIKSIRISTADHWIRILFAVKDKKIVLLHAVEKKQNRLDPQDIKLAESRFKKI